MPGRPALSSALRPRPPAASEAIEAIIELVGCYILEVGYREHGGKFSWYEKGQQPVLIVGEPTFHVAMMAFDKVRGRVSGDRGDNIPFFYEGFRERVNGATPGSRAVYVWWIGAIGTQPKVHRMRCFGFKLAQR